MTFDRIVVINLARRPERLVEFEQRLAVAWPEAAAYWLEVATAVDGQACPAPDWWGGLPGAWGCYRSHVNVLEMSLMDGVESLLVFEDDACFAPGFRPKLAACLAALPDDWAQFYLGGQHLRHPRPVNELVVKGSNVNRTHAYALRGSERIAEAYRWLQAGEHWRGTPKKKFHVDHHFGKLHAKSTWPVYAAREWLCGQAASSSDIQDKGPPKEHWWK